MSSGDNIQALPDIIFGLLFDANAHRRRHDIANWLQMTPAQTTSVKRDSTSMGEQLSTVSTVKRARLTCNDDDTPTICITEIIDIDAVRHMLSHLELLCQQERPQFVSYAERSMQKNGSMSVQYKHTDSSEFGRFYAQGPSLQRFSRRLRATLVHRIAVDIDMQNAHPNILSTVARKHQWSFPALEQYRANREAVLASIPLSRDEAKTLMLAQMFGGNVRKMLKDADQESLIDQLPSIVWRFGDDMKRAAQLVYDNYPRFAAAAIKSQEEKNGTNFKFSCLSLFLQHSESEAVQSAMTFLALDGWTVIALIHDGFMVLKRDADNRFVDEVLLEAVRCHVKEQCHLDLVFTVKKFEEPFPLK